MPTIDNLDIKISAESSKASDSIDDLILKFRLLQNAISRIDISNISGISGIVLPRNNIGNPKKSISSGIGETTKQVNNTTKKVKKSVKGLSSAIGSFWANYYWVVNGVKKVYASIEDTADYIEAYNYFNVSLDKIGAEWSSQFAQYGYNSAESYAESFRTRLSERLSKLSGVQIDEDSGLLVETGMKNLGLNIKEVTQYASQLASVTNSVGQKGEVSLAAADAFTRLAGDIGSLFNIDYSSVAKNLQSGLIGQSRALYKYGIDITNATLQTYAYELGLEKAVSEMTQAEKMQLRMIAVLDQSKVAWGDLANTLESPSNQLRILKNNISEISIIFGQLFVPIMNEVLPVINGASIALKRLLVDLAGVMGIELDLSSFGQGYDDSLEDTAEGLDEITEAAEKAKKSLRGFDELKTISSGSIIGTGAASGVDSIDLTKQILSATGEYETVWDKAFSNMQDKAGEIADDLEGKFRKAIDVLDDFTPAIVGAGTALVTYNIASKLGAIGKALSAFATPTGLIALGIGALVGLGVAIINLKNDMEEADLASRFGNISLSLEELDSVAAYILQIGNLDGLSEFLSSYNSLDGYQAKIDGAVEELNKLNWKVSVGMELTGQEQEEYKTAIETYINTVNGFITDNAYTASLAIKLLLGDSEEGSELQGTFDTFYSNVQGKVSELGQKLNETVTAAWNDGILDIDEVNAITRIQNEMAEIQENLATYERNARLKLLQEEYSGKELTAESYKELQAKREEILSQYKEDMDEALVYAIAQRDYVFETQYNELAGNKFLQDLTRQEYEKDIEALKLGRNEKLLDPYLNTLIFDTNTLLDTYGEEIETSSSFLNGEFEKLKDVILSNQIELGEDLIPDFESEIMYLLSGEGIISRAEKDNLKKLIEAMMPMEDLEQLAASYYETTGEIPQAIIDALSVQTQINAIVGEEKAIFKAMLLGTESEEKQELLNKMEEAGIDVTEYLIYGVMDGEPDANNSITGLINDMSETVLDNKSLSSAMKKIGSDAVESLSDSLSQGLNFSLSVPSIGKMTGPNSKITIAAYANGGFPEDGWFRASKGEYFGRFDDGTSYIANNNQITDGIAKAVYEAMMAASGGASSSPIIKVFVGDRELTDIAIEGINQRTRATGKTPLRLAF